MFLLVRLLLKLGIPMTNESLCLSQSIPSIFIPLAFLPDCCSAKFNSVVLHGLSVSNIFSLECHLCNLNPRCRNKMMEPDFNFVTSFILSPQVTKSSTYHLLLFQHPLETLTHSFQNEHRKLRLI